MLNNADGFQTVLLVAQLVVGSFAAILAWAWNRSVKTMDENARALLQLERNHAALALKVESEHARKTDLEAMEDRVRHAISDIIRPVADDVAIIKKAFMELRR